MISITQKGQNKNVGFPTFLFCLFPTLLFYPLQEEIEDFIELLDNPRELLAIRYRYIDGMKLEDIAENMSYSVRSVAHFLSKGVKHLTEIANAEGLSLPCSTRVIRR